MARRPLEHPRNWAFLAAGEFLAGLSGYTSGIAELDNALDAEAAPINAKTGTLVSYEHLGGGLDGPRTLGVITLRAGNAEEVAKAQIKDVEAAGFSANHLFLPCGGQTGACSFLGQSTVTDVMIETVAANTTTRSGLEIPPGMTGVIISLSAQPGRAVPTSGAAEAPPRASFRTRLPIRRHSSTSGHAPRRATRNLRHNIAIVRAAVERPS